MNFVNLVYGNKIIINFITIIIIRFETFRVPCRNWDRFPKFTAAELNDDTISCIHPV